jgi:hypothetical protein
MERTPTNSKPWVHIEALNFEGMAASAILSIRQNQKGMAGTTGLEPAASAVTGQRSNQLNYVPTRQRGCACSLPERQLSLGNSSILTVYSGSENFKLGRPDSR